MTTKIKSNLKSVKKSRDQLVDDFKRLIEDFQDLTGESANASSAAIQRGYDAVQDDLKNGIHNVGDKIAASAEHYKNSAEKSIGKNPWRSIAIAAVAGLLLDRFLPR